MKSSSNRARSVVLPKPFAVQSLSRGGQNGPPIARIAKRQARKAPKVLVAARIDRDVYDWLQGYGEGYSTRINAILRAVMSRNKRTA